MQAALNQPTLVDLVFPRIHPRWHDVLLVIAGSLLTALSAQIAIPLPWTPVPLTGQTFAVLLCGVTMGWKRGAMSQILYLLEGAAGLPVLAEHPSGFWTMLGPTGGYLAAFPIAAALTGFLAQRGWDRRFTTMLLCMILGNLVIYLLGMAWLSRFLPINQLATRGMLPFIPGDLLKAILVAAAFPAIWKTGLAR